MLQGNSNYTIELKSNNKCFSIVKKAQNEKDFERLLQQVHKQKNFYHLIKNNEELNHFFEVPEVIDIHLKNSNIEMKFCNGKSILDIIEQEDIFIIDSVLEKLFIFLQWEFDNSPIHFINDQVWFDKIDNLIEKIKDKKIQKLLGFLREKNKIEIPIGRCHGDLTFSNMLFSNKIVLLDFLDSFIETPLIDLTKLIQEIYLKWSLLICNENRDYSKINIGYNYLKKRFESKFEEFIKVNSISLETIQTIYKITLIRILPYCKSKKIYDEVCKEIL